MSVESVKQKKRSFGTWDSAVEKWREKEMKMKPQLMDGFL